MEPELNDEEIAAIAKFIKERDENTLPEEMNDEERMASARCILRILWKMGDAK